MSTDVVIDEKLLKVAQKLSGLKTEDIVNLALKEFIQRRKQEEIIDFFGKVEYDRDYEYKNYREKYKE